MAVRFKGNLVRFGAGVAIVLVFFGPQTSGRAQSAVSTAVPGAAMTAAPVLVNLSTLRAHAASQHSTLPFRHPQGQAGLDRAKGASRQPAASTTATAPLSASLAQSFNGISSNETACFCSPPDGAIAASPSYVIGAVNTAFKIWNPQGGLVGPAFELSALFSVNSTCLSTSDIFGALSDPFVEYDKASGRFILGAISFDILTYDSAICIAVTLSGNPTGTWAIYAFHVDASTSTLFDFPHLGIGSDALYTTGNLFPNGGNFSGVRVYAFNKAQMYADQVATSQYHDIPASTLGTFDTLSPAREVGVAKTMYFTASENCNTCSMSQIGVWKWTDPFGTNTLNQTGTVGCCPGEGHIRRSVVIPRYLWFSFEADGPDTRSVGLKKPVALSLSERRIGLCPPERHHHVERVVDAVEGQCWVDGLVPPMSQLSVPAVHRGFDRHHAEVMCNVLIRGPAPDRLFRIGPSQRFDQYGCTLLEPVDQPSGDSREVTRAARECGIPKPL
jgi:hypothetical protein